MNDDHVILLHPDLGDPAPPCFTEREWDDWIEAEAVQYLHPEPSSYCSACTPYYKKRMMAEGKCSHPGTTFTIDDDGFTGHRPEEKQEVRWIRLHRDPEL